MTSEIAFSEVVISSPWIRHVVAKKNRAMRLFSIFGDRDEFFSSI